MVTRAKGGSRLGSRDSGGDGDKLCCGQWRVLVRGNKGVRADAVAFGLNTG